MSIKKGKSDTSKWDEAIADAQRKLTEGKIYVARLRAAIKAFEKNKLSGEPWPAKSATQN